jgi:curved DNA-binding protein CbpA
MATAFASSFIPGAAASASAREFIQYARNDYYGALDVATDANATTIARAYRTLALRYHPDKLPRETPARERREATLRFKVMAEAKKVLMDDKTRTDYDETIAAMPRWARPKFGKRSVFEKEEVKFSAWVVVAGFTTFCVGFASVAQYTSRAADKQSLMSSTFYAQKLKQRNKNMPKSERIDAEAYFEEFLVEFGLTDLTGWRHTTGGKLLARLRLFGQRGSNANQTDANGVIDESGSETSESAEVVAAVPSAGKKKGKKKRRDANVANGGRRAELALRMLRAEGESKRERFGESYDIE